MVQHISETYPGFSAPLPKLFGHVADPAELAHAKLAASAYLSLRTLTCDSHEGVLAIRGQVSSFHLKQLAQTVVRDTAGVEEINNQVLVVCPTARPRPASPR